ncbi:efflux RND transporter periplasmic adaptor subunit [Derxia gummosa]|uniref:Efflux RND transporter periplasmic adaptor subunit n=1 Tax=Derxia gummosa DSM 723 TaxID=1121388 RepID=A0A8B6X8L7_9BURK|nr:efflux RND transporter periplasmic adaptor subunit [Derxia gummosa]
MTSQDPVAAHPRALRRAGWIAGAFLLALAGGAGLRLAASARQAQSLDESTRAAAPRSVLVGHPRPAEGARALALPGSLRGASEAAIYARTSGYLRGWDRDLGDRVRRGERLAFIDAPETEQELAQARAAREQVLARLGLAETSLARWRDLRERDAVSQQEVDERAAALRQARADLAAADANIRRLEQLLSFRSIVAPFDGVIARRNVEVGALVGAGNAGTARELFRIVQTDPLRVAVAVPQANLGAIAVGQEATLRLLERPQQVIKGKVARRAGTIDPDSRSMVVEVDVPNPDGKLLPGAYVEVSFVLGGGRGGAGAPGAPGGSGGKPADAVASTGKPAGSPDGAAAPRPLVVPASALQYRQDGPRLALVGADDRVELRDVKLGRDLGRQVEVIAGLKPDDRVVLNPHDAIRAGEQVLPTEAPPAGPSGARP